MITVRGQVDPVLDPDAALLARLSGPFPAPVACRPPILRSTTEVAATLGLYSSQVGQLKLSAIRKLRLIATVVLGCPPEHFEDRVEAFRRLPILVTVVDAQHAPRLAGRGRPGKRERQAVKSPSRRGSPGDPTPQEQGPVPRREPSAPPGGANKL